MPSSWCSEFDSKRIIVTLTVNILDKIVEEKDAKLPGCRRASSLRAICAMPSWNTVNGVIFARH